MDATNFYILVTANNILGFYEQTWGREGIMGGTQNGGKVENGLRASTTLGPNSAISE